MSDNPTPSAPASPAASEAAPAAPSPVAAPLAPPPASVVTTPAVAEPVPPAVETPAPGPEAPPVAAAAAEAVVAAKLESEPAPPEAAPAEAAAPPTYSDFTLPEGVQVAPEQMAEATKVLTKYGVPQEAAQELVTLHANGVQQAINQYSKGATDFWNAKSKEWVAEAKKTFGNNFDTSLNTARSVWDQVLPNKTDRERLFADLTDTKIGDHPVLMKAMTEVGRRMQQVLTATGTTTWDAAMRKIREPAAPPPATPARAPGSSGRAADRRYQPRA